MKILILGSDARSFINFRGDLISALCKKNEVLCCGPKDSSNIVNEIEKLGASYIPIKINRNRINFFDDLQYLLSLVRLIRRVRPDKILSYTIKPNIFGGIAAYFFSKCHFFPMITGLGAVFNTNSKFNILRYLVIFLYRMSLKRAYKVIFQNHDNMYYFKGLGLVIDEQCTLILGSGVNPDRYPKSPLPDQPVFLMIARLLFDKGVIEYLEASKLVKEKFPQARFLLVGPFENSSNGLSKLDLEKYNDTNHVEYLGQTTDVTQYIKMCSVYVLPSYHEGIPRSTLEAMSMGRPVITTNAPGCKETVLNGYNGWTVPKANVIELTDKMNWFVEHPKLWEDMGNNSYRMVEDTFDVKIINRQILAAMCL